MTGLNWALYSARIVQTETILVRLALQSLGKANGVVEVAVRNYALKYVSFKFRMGPVGPL